MVFILRLDVIDGAHKLCQLPRGPERPSGVDLKGHFNGRLTGGTDFSDGLYAAFGELMAAMSAGDIPPDWRLRRSTRS